MNRKYLNWLEAQWSVHRKWILALLFVVLVVAAGQRLINGFQELIGKPNGAIDLGLRYGEVHLWFAGESLAGIPSAIYPPASYPILWPFLGWLSFPQARWLWAMTTIAALAWLAYIAAREGGAKSSLERMILMLLPLAAYPARAVIVNGQLTLHLLPPILGGVMLLGRQPSSWKRDLGGAALLLVGLVKLTIAVPFLWLVLAAKRPFRSAAILGSGYIALTGIAALFQPTSVVTLLRQWSQRAVQDATLSSSQSHANIHSWLGALGLQKLNLPISLLVLALLGVVLYACRRSDLWLRLGIAAVIARVWSFHYRYDDILLIIPLLALVRLVARSSVEDREKFTAAAIMVLLAWTLLAPARFLFLPRPWSALYESFQTLVWLTSLAYLVYRARLNFPGKPSLPSPQGLKK